MSPRIVTSLPRTCNEAPVSRSTSFRFEFDCPSRVCVAPGSSKASFSRGRSGGLNPHLCSTVPNMRPGETLADLVTVMKRLLAPDGCPWDREQTLASLKSYLLEETYEVLEAIEEGAPADHCEELGDLLMQIVFQAELRAGSFDIDDVVRAITDKLVRRHPH